MNALDRREEKEEENTQIATERAINPHEIEAEAAHPTLAHPPIELLFSKDSQ